MKKMSSMTSKTKLTTKDLDELATSTPSSSQELDRRLAKIEEFIAKFDTSNMMVSDEQVVYLAAYRAVLQGLADVMPNFNRRPHALHQFLLDAKRTAECAVVVYRGGDRADMQEVMDKYA